ncbi:ATP-binding protein [Geomonas nitrogeniifigens]|uniref:ATP-binding protein n=1 Tax=Geomonas diazotrophica TaxID=2843197 RepID=A0ABX8JPC0_9BACT|nr:ATP-binding protein [Geomonas nitrogeniifigens]QWV97275.1 ATP-binding protein [Geomonas nitrogeniifigens]
MSIISFPEDVWVSGAGLEDILTRAHFTILNSRRLKFDIAPGTKILIDASVIFLSLLNQLAYDGKAVILDFTSQDSNVMGYLDRMGFFDNLDPSITVLPATPAFSKAKIFGRSNLSVVEIAAIDFADYDELPSRLADALENKCKKLSKASFTIFGELIDNVFEHSSTDLRAFAALQAYKNGVKVIVSDSGEGLLDTLRPQLPKKYAKYSDIEVILQAFENGLSRFGEDSGRGCGLATCAQKAVQYHGNLEVRLSTSRVNLVPSGNSYTPNTAYCYSNLLPIRGTHISFDFPLDE